MTAETSAKPTGAFAEGFKKMPPLGQLPGAPQLEASLLIPARSAGHALEHTVTEARRALSLAFPGSFEIVLIPNPAPGAEESDPSGRIAEDLALRFPGEVVVKHHRRPLGKGAALRTGFEVARGKAILFTDADLPYELSFFEISAQMLRSGFDLVTGNRRLDTSVFDLPVSLLPVAYSRHRLGLLFNRVARRLLPLETTDTQAGIKAMSHRLALSAFSRQRCPGFFFDLELFLTARAHGFKHVEVPVALRMNTEKSTVRILREGVLALFWMGRIAWAQSFKKAYGPGAALMTASTLLPRYRDSDLSTRFFLQARWRLTPYLVMASKLPPQGKILDLGCGHGLFSLALALGSPDREVIGLDHDRERIALARKAAGGVSNVRFADGTLSSPDSAPADEPVVGISMIDVMHYFGRAEQERLFREAYSLLKEGGTLIVREVNPGDGIASWWNRLYEKLATTTGFTRSDNKQSLSFRNREEWEELLRRTGFEVTSERCSHFLFADILYVCRKPSRKTS